MTKNTKEFLKVFNKVETYLNTLNKSSSYVSVSKLLKPTSEKNPIIKDYANDLREYAELRNAIVHEEAGTAIADVKARTVSDLKRIYRLIKKPPTVYQLFKKNVTCCQTDDSLLEIIKIMKENTFTHMPVYDKIKFVGVLNEASISRWLGDFVDGKLSNLKETEVGDLQAYLRNQPDEHFKFVSKDTNAYLVKKWFLEFVRERKRLGAIFITENGRRDEGLLGVITAWDLPEIDQ